MMSYRPVSWTEEDPREGPLPLQGTELLASSEVHWRLNSLLREYQREGVQFMWERLGRGAGGILCDDMGLGKTVQVIALLSAVFRKNGERRDRDLIRDLKLDDRRVEPALVICPSSLLSNWAAELERWGYFCHLKYHGQDRGSTFTQARHGRVEIVLTSFGTAREFCSQLNTVNWQLVVVDECHKIKEKNSAITLALKSLSCLRRVGLTGTALQNNYEELWCLLDWANPGCLGTLEQFKSEFSLPMVRGFRQDATADELADARKKQEKFNALKQHWMIRRTKASEIADQLPAKFDHVIFCGLSDYQQEVFKFLLALPEIKAILTAYESCSCGKKRPRHLCCEKPDQAASATSPQAMLLQTIQVFLKVANHPALLLPDNTNSVAQAELGEEICRGVVQKFPELKENNFLNLSNPRYSGKMDVLTGLLAHLESEGAKVLLFSYSTSVLNIIETFIQSKGYSYCRLDGSTRVGARQEMVNTFNQDQGIFLFLLSTKAGGLGLNITGANTVIIFDPNWNPSHDSQAQDRAYRLGQTRDVRVFRLISAGCIEEVVYLRQLYKQQLAANTVDGSTAKRFFKAVHGDKNRQGELFGIKNLLRVTSNINRSGLTEDMEKRYKDIEDKILRKSKVSISVQNFELNNLLEDPFGIEEELEDGDDVENFSPGETVDISRTIETPEVRFVYGRTPEEIKQKYFTEICQDLDLSKEDLAKTVMERSWLEKLEMIRKLHSSDKQALEIIDICKTEFENLSRNQTQQSYLSEASDSAMTILSAKTGNSSSVKELISCKDHVESRDSISATSVQDFQCSSSPSPKKNDSPTSNPESLIRLPERPLKPAPEGVYLKKRRIQYESEEFSQSAKSELDEIFPDVKKIRNNQSTKRLIDEKKIDEYLVEETIDDIFG